ncbi:FkbM family methyltransferase [Candidatus Babeliales bacterium]|nr:FkbM family methyltransferase [Candidatus Babeliales bacterium]
MCFVNYNANFLFNRAINVIKVVKNLFRENIKYKKSKKFPTKNNLLFTFCKLELSYLFNKVGDKDSIFGFDISFPDRYEFNFVFQEIFVNKDYYVNLDNDFPTIIDCGCYVGLSILFFKLLYPNSEILGFEAHPKTFQILRNNIEKSKLSNITLFNNAVYNSEGTLEFSCVNSGSSKILGKKRESNLRNNVIYVNSILLSDYINKPVDLLKMDIEGAEVEVIEELAKHNKLRFIKNIVMEFHSLSNAKRLTKILMTLDKEGFFYRISEACKDVAIIHAYQN